MTKFNISQTTWLIISIIVAVVRLSNQMACSYGDRGSLTVFCVNATSRFFKISSYRFDHLDETLKCFNCSLESLDAGTFDISGNQIKQLDITNSNIKVIHPKAFIGLIFMEKILLSNNPIQHIYPEAFTGIRKVKYIELENAISTLEPKVFKELHALEVLILKKNSLVKIEPGTFEGLHNLKILDLSNNLIQVIEGSLTPLINLVALKLEHNNLKKIEGNMFDMLRSLLLLNLSHNNIIKFNMLMNEDNKLRILNLSVNALETKLLKRENFVNLNNLEELDLSSNPIDNLPVGLFLGLKHLRILKLNGNQLKVIKTGSFSGLPHLNILDLSGNLINEIQITGVFGSHSLHTLNLADNKLKNYNYLGLIEKMENIKYVNLLNNELPCHIMQDLELEFEEDGVEYQMSSSIDKDCSKISKTPEELNKSILELYEEQFENNTTTWLFIMLSLILFLVVVLFYIQFFILQSRNKNGFDGTFLNVNER